MQDHEDQNVNQPTGETIKAAFSRAAEKCGGKPRMLAALNITESWMYTCISRGVVALPLGLKLQVLTGAEFKWQDLCPDEYQKINAVAEYLV